MDFVILTGLLVAQLVDRLLASKQATQRIDVERFDLKKLNDQKLKKYTGGVRTSFPLPVDVT
jgi:hypothetical protein